MACFRRRAQVSVLLPIYMVAGSYRFPALRAGGSRVDPWLLGPTIVDMSDVQSKTAASSLPLWTKERLTSGEARKWIEEAEPLLSQGQRALLHGVTPASFIKYKLATLPAPLVADAALGVTEAMVQTRVQLLRTVTDSNEEKVATQAAAYAELRAELFSVVERALQANAPLLLLKLKAECKQGAPFEAYFDGKSAWDKLKAMSERAASLPGEEASHDAYLTKLDLSPLPKGATAEQFSTRVTFALTQHVPYVRRPFPNDEAISEWVISQAPEEHRARAQDKFDMLTAAEKSDPHGVASMIVNIIARSRTTLDVLKESELREFIGNVDDDSGGRRPPGLGKGGGGAAPRPLLARPLVCGAAAEAGVGRRACDGATQGRPARAGQALGRGLQGALPRERRRGRHAVRRRDRRPVAERR